MIFQFGTPDPRVRSFLLPTRIVWTSASGVQSPDALLATNEHTCALTPQPDTAAPALLLDFGREIHGGVRIECPLNSGGAPARVRVRFGESASEAMSSPNNDHAIHDQETLVPWMGQAEIGNTAFRFVRIDLLEPETSVQLKQVCAVFLYRPLDYQGSFECSDPLLNRIWKTGAYTVHLCMQDHVWDGAKRDRLVWIGDIHPESRVISTVFGEQDVLPASLDRVRDTTPLPAWMNGISSYSLWWIITQRDWYLWHGNFGYLQEQRAYLTALLTRVEECLDEQGAEHLDGHRFLEWPTSENPAAIDAGLQALVVIALRAGAYLCEEMGESSAAERARNAAKRAAACVRDAGTCKQAVALQVLAGTADAGEVNRTVLSVDPFHGLSTFYGYYILQARAAAGDHAGALELLRRYWGGMLQMGATTFWEDFDIDWMQGSAGIDDLVPEGKRDIHADFGNYCYKGLRHSLCHGWAAGPTAWLTGNVLGVRPLTPGFERAQVRPGLGGLLWAKGTVPTPRGLLTVEHRVAEDGSVHSAIDAPGGVQIEK